MEHKSISDNHYFPIKRDFVKKKLSKDNPSWMEVHPPWYSIFVYPWDSAKVTPKWCYVTFVEHIMQPPKYYDYVM